MKKLFFTLILTVMMGHSNANAENLINCLRGWDSTENGHHTEAISLFEKCIDEGSLSKATLARTYRNLGIASRRLNEFSKSVSYYDQAIALNPKDVVNDYVNRANSHSQNGNYNKAMEDYNKALSIKPDYAEIFYNRGIHYERISMPDQASFDFINAYRLGLRSEALYDKFIEYKLFDLQVISYTVKP